MSIPNESVLLPVRNPYTADSGLGGGRTGPGSILRFLRKKALMTQSAPPAPLARPGKDRT